MKNGKKTALAAAIAVVFLAACGNRVNETVASGEIVVPEMSSEELLATSLEYLLLDNTEDMEEVEKQGAETQDSSDQASDAQDAPDQTKEQDETEDLETVPDSQIHQEENDVQGEGAVIYYGNGGSSVLRQETIELEEKTPDELIGALARHNIVSLDTKVISFEEEEQNNAKVLRLDLSKAAGEYLRTMSKEAECIIVASVVNTFVENYGADAIYLTVEGKTLSTSNMEYTEALGMCTPEELMEMLGDSDTDTSGKTAQDEE